MHFIYYIYRSIATKADSTYKKTTTQCKIIDNISLALMEQFNLIPVAKGMLAIIHVNTY